MTKKNYEQECLDRYDSLLKQIQIIKENSPTEKNGWLERIFPVNKYKKILIKYLDLKNDEFLEFNLDFGIGHWMNGTFIIEHMSNNYIYYIGETHILNSTGLDYIRNNLSNLHIVNEEEAERQRKYNISKGTRWEYNFHDHGLSFIINENKSNISKLDNEIKKLNIKKRMLGI